MSDLQPPAERRERVSDSAVDALAGHVIELVEQTTALHAEVKLDAHWRKRAIRGLAIAMALLLVFSALNAFIAFDGRAVRDRIESCTTPEGECYQQGQAQQGQAILQIVCAADANTRLVATAIVQSFQPNVTLHLPPPSKVCDDASSPTTTTGGG